MLTTENKFLGWRTNSHVAQNYVDFIENALSNENVFESFRRGGHQYDTILEHLSYEDGRVYLQYIQREYPHLINSFDKFKINDSIGFPYIYDYGEKYGNINPTTLRYIKFAGDIQKHFGDLNGMDLIEIGGGYGGLVRVLSSMYEFNSVRLHDLTPAKKLQKKYLNRFDINPIIDASIENIVTDNSIVISNYAWCECDLETRNNYVDKMVKKAKYTYMVVYDVDVEAELLSLDGDKFIEKDIFNPCDIFYRKK